MTGPRRTAGAPPAARGPRAPVLENLSRRAVLKGLLGAGGLVLGVRLLPGCALPAAAGAGDTALALGEPVPFGVYLSIRPGDGLVQIVAHRSEMGTGIRTVLPMVLADELGADWDKVEVVQAEGDRRYGSQNTDGSRSIRDFLDPLRRAGAGARTMLERAAAARWGVPAGECRAASHHVEHGASGRRLSFGELVDDAAGLAVPSPAELVLRAPSERTLGDVPLVDAHDITTGAAVYGYDVARPGTKIAVIARCPVLGGRVAFLDDSAARAVPGVEAVVVLPAAREPFAFAALGGVAVVARDTWSALKGRDALVVDWDEGPRARASSEEDDRRRVEAVSEPGRVVLDRGDAGAALARAARRVDAVYEAPYLAHAPMEPPCALAEFRDGRCEAWAPTQNPQAARSAVAAALGVPEADVTVHVTLLGGGFGRKSKPDVVCEAALLAREVSAPVKVLWTREDDLHHDYFHAAAAVRCEAGLDEQGRSTAWRVRSAFPSISWTFDARSKGPSDGELSQGVLDLPFDLPHLRCEAGDSLPAVRIGWLRSVCNVFHAFAIGSFVDELAAAAGRDPREVLLELLGRPRHVDPADDGVRYGNYGESLQEHPIDTGRLRHVVELATARAGWGSPLPPRQGRGLAVHRSFASYVAAVVHAAVAEDGRISIPRIDLAADCGQIVHRDRVLAQMEGAAVFGASLALYGAITLKDGRVQQHNFDTYRLARHTEAPARVHVHLVDSDAPPGGVGEPGVPPIAPALCNALFAATGRRIRGLPVAGITS